MAALAPAIAAAQTFLAAAAPTLQAIGTAATIGGTIATGVAANNAARSEALQLEAKANEEKAAASQEAQAFDRRRQLALSRIRNVSAASGFSADDPTSLNLLAETDEYGTLQSALTRYGGVSRASSLRSQAEASRRSGSAALYESVFDVGRTIAGSAKSMASKYGMTPEEGALDIRPKWARSY